MVEWIQVYSILPNFKVQMRPRRASRIAHGAKLLTLRDILTLTHEKCVQVGIESCKSVAVVDYDHAAVAAVPAVSSRRNETAVGGSDRRTRPGSNVDGSVPTPIVLGYVARGRKPEIARCPVRPRPVQVPDISKPLREQRVLRRGE